MKPMRACLCSAMILLTTSIALAADETEVPPFVQGLLDLDAPARDWHVVSEKTHKPKPSALVRFRMLLSRKPQDIAGRLTRVDVPTLHDVAQVADSDPDQQRFGREWHAAVAKWLETSRRRLLPTYGTRLVQAVRDLHFSDHGIEGKEDLAILARTEWDQARTILDDLRRHDDDRVRAYATAFLYAHSTGDEQVRLREKLQEIGTNRSRSGFARKTALEALLSSSWPDHGAWALSLFNDPTLIALREGNHLYRPLNRLVANDRETWIPQVIPLIDGHSRAAHNNAVSALVQFQLESARADALRPLLPWLRDPSWSSAPDRLRLLQSLDRVDLPEAIPGLRVVVENEDGWRLRAAASALEHYRAPVAIPELRMALLRTEGRIQSYVHIALDACGGLDTPTRSSAREAHALRLEAELHGAVRDTEPVSEAAQLGAYLTAQGKPSTSVAEIMIARANELQSAHADAAARLRSWVGTLPRTHPYVTLVQQLASGSLAPEALARELPAREAVASACQEQLVSLLARGGVLAGCAAFLLDEQPVMNGLLRGDDRDAQMALLACARLTRFDFNIDRIAALYALNHAGLAGVSDAYLLAIDTPEARALLWARHPDEALLVGVRDEDAAPWEKRLRDEVLAANGPEEVIALLGYVGGTSIGHVVIRIRNGNPTLCTHHEDREPRTFAFTANALQTVRAFLEKNKADTLPAYQPTIYDGVHYTFLRLTRRGGYRIYMNNPGHTRRNTEDVYAQLDRFMRVLVDRIY